MVSGCQAGGGGRASPSPGNADMGGLQTHTQETRWYPASFCSSMHVFFPAPRIQKCYSVFTCTCCSSVEGSFKQFPGCWRFGVVIFGGKTENHFGPKEKAFPKKEIVCRKAPFSFYLNILNISRRNIHCTLMVKRYKFITSYKNYHLKVILFI